MVRHKVLVEGRSQRAVARELGLARVTVRKYLEQADAARKPEAERRRPVWELVAPRVESVLTESAHWTGGKQQLTATRLHELLVAEGHRVGVTLVKEAVAEWKRQRREVFVPLTYRPGDLAEVDFFEVLIDVDGIRRKAWLFLMRLMYSGRDFAWIYERQDQISFLDGHVRAFAHFAAVPARLAYDNLRAAVVRILVGGERALTLRFAALASHYLFEPCFCRPGEGHDKGGVEARGKAVRRQALVPIPSAPTLAAINQALLARHGRAAGHRARCRRPDDWDAVHRGNGALSCPTTAVCRGGDDGRDRLAARAGAARGRRLLGAVSVGGARSDRPHRRHHGHDRRPRRHTDRAIRASGLDSARSTTGITCRSWRANRKPCAKSCPSSCAISGGPFPAVWDHFHAAHAPREAARLFAKVLGQLDLHGFAVVVPAVEAALRRGTPVLLALTPGAVAPRLAAEVVPAALRDVDVASGCAADYDGWLAEAV